LYEVKKRSSLARLIFSISESMITKRYFSGLMRDDAAYNRSIF
jgi:hypothetical protein